MCYPFMSEGVRADLVSSTLSQTPFPCEQVMYLEDVCSANGTTPIDFAAEQQCLCGGNYFAASTGCADCFDSHGGKDDDRDDWVSFISSLSTAECAPATPTEPFSNLRTPTPSSLLSGASTTTRNASYDSAADRLRSKTAASEYYTGGTKPTPGPISGDATGRATKFTNFDEVRFTPTGAKKTPGGPAVTTGAGDAAATTSSTAAAAHRTAAGGLAAMFVGPVMML